MVNNIKMNFKNSYKNNLACEQCTSGESESQCHALTCPGWEEQRAGLDLSSLEDMVTFFSRVLEDKARKKTDGVSPDEKTGLCWSIPVWRLVDASPWTCNTVKVILSLECTDNR